jgi:bifunctional non-homologous end joining protein LigD
MRLSRRTYWTRCTIGDAAPGSKHWIHEIEHDGYRSLILLERRQARVFTRNGFDWTDRYPSIARAASNLRCKSPPSLMGRPLRKTATGPLILSHYEQQCDGSRKASSTIVRSTASGWQRSSTSTAIRASGRAETICRRRRLNRIQFSEEFDGNGDTLFKTCADREREGIVSKHVMSPYQSGRSKTWLRSIVRAG